MIPLNVDKLLEAFYTQREINKDIYDKVREEDYDKTYAPEAPTIRHNVITQLATHKAFLDGTSTGKLNFTNVTSYKPTDEAKQNLLLQLVQVDKHLINLFRSSDCQTRSFLVPWSQNQVELPEVLLSLIMHETHYVGVNSTLVKILNTTNTR